jgi:transcriptional regulator with XRE-family HTH domain
MLEPIFKLLQQRSGLSETQIREYLSCSKAEVSKWLANIAQPSAAVLHKLGALLEKIEAETDQYAMQLCKDSTTQKKRVFLFQDDKSAQKHGWPTASVYGMVAANLYSAFEGNIEIYYGQTPPTFGVEKGEGTSIEYIQSLIDNDGSIQ